MNFFSELFKACCGCQSPKDATGSGYAFSVMSYCSSIPETIISVIQWVTLCWTLQWKDY